MLNKTELLQKAPCIFLFLPYPLFSLCLFSLLFNTCIFSVDFFHLSKDFFSSSTNLFLVSPFDVAFLCVSLSTCRAYFSLFTVFATRRSAIEKLKVDCMRISYFSFSSRGRFLFPPISMKLITLKCFLLLLPDSFTHLSVSYLFFHFISPFPYCCLAFNFSGRMTICGGIQITVLWINTVTCISALLTNTDFLTASISAFCSIFSHHTLSSRS